MQKKLWVVLALVLVMPAFLFTVSCQKKVQAQAPAPAPAAKPAAPAPAPAPAAKLDVPSFMTERIYFDFDKSALKLEAQALLKKKADWLKANAGAKLLIEGNCDERGTAEYNLALGERRAEAAKKFLVDLGIDAKRISTISYGDMRRACTEPTEECRQRNRRVDVKMHNWRPKRTP
jgi:peptidoglycan-associated lipoprotein